MTVNGGKSGTPSGPLCFFLRVEKEEAAQMPINKGTVNKGDGGTPSGFVRSRATSRIHLPRGGRLLAAPLRLGELFLESMRILERRVQVNGTKSLALRRGAGALPLYPRRG